MRKKTVKGLSLIHIYLGQEPTTVVDLTEESPVILREGSGSTDPFI